MSTVTPNLGLFKYDTTNVTDLASAFNINTALNNNWDKIDEAISNSGVARNIGEIVASTIPLTNAGLHLLDGALIQGGGIYQEFVDYISNLYNTSTKYSNVTKIGTLTDNNGIISGFSNDNYMTYSGSIPTITSFEEVIKIKTASVSTAQAFISDNSYKGFGTVKVTSAGKIQAYISSNGTSNDIMDGTTSSLSVQGNTDYWVKLYWDGTTYKIDVSTDGSVYTNYISVTNSNRPFFDGFIGFGKDTGGVDEHFLGSIDLNESYIKINGSLWWVGTIADGFTIEDIWQNSITNYGVCGKFVYDSVNNTVRLPKITGIVEGTTDLTTLGDLVEAGLPNLSGWFQGVGFGNQNCDAVLFQSGWAGENVNNNGQADTTFIFDASRYNSIYGNSTTVQPQTIKVLYYIVIATSTKTEIEVDIDEIATDLNGKADVDLTNCTKPHIVETYVNGASWYRVYSDGWCEQGGFLTGAETSVTLLKPYENTNYQIYCQWCGGKSTNFYASDQYISSITVSGFITNGIDNGNVKQRNWMTCGYIS